jgi:hypothetical protein
LPATDLVAVITEAVLLFSSIQQSVKAVSRMAKLDSYKPLAASVMAEFTTQCVTWVSKLNEVSSVLDDYEDILKWYEKFDQLNNNIADPSSANPTPTLIAMPA